MRGSRKLCESTVAIHPEVIAVNDDFGSGSNVSRVLEQDPCEINTGNHRAESSNPARWCRGQPIFVVDA